MTNIEDELKDWIRDQLNNAVQVLGDTSLFEDPIIEVKPAWVLPSQILVGKARAPGDPTAFKWFICGNVPLDYVHADSATTPREVIRHFALKWQVDAENLEDDAAKALIEDAESLYALAEDDRFWG